MTQLLLKVRVSLGGGVCGSLLGIIVGGLGGAIWGAVTGDVSIGLNGAILGGTLGLLAGAIYGIVLVIADPNVNFDHESGIVEKTLNLPFPHAKKERGSSPEVGPMKS